MHVSIVRAEIYKAEANDQMNRLKLIARKSLFRSDLLFIKKTLKPRIIYMTERTDRISENIFITMGSFSRLHF